MTRQLRATAVTTVVDGPVATVTVGSGLRRNALDSTGWALVERQFDALADDGSVRAVVVRGAGATFCAGSDMTEWAGADTALIEASFAQMEASFRAVERCPVPVVALVRGVAAGAGCQLALACDLRIMADTARIGMPIARLGILPSPAFAARLLRAAGPELAGETLYSGRLVDASRARACGLARAVIDAELDAHVERLVTDIAEQPAAAVRAAKRALHAATGEPSRQRLGPAVDHDAFQRGVESFLRRRA